MNQAEFHLAAKPATQAQKILDLLALRRGKWVPMTDLWRASGAFAVHSRVSDLRKAGHQIRQQSARRADGTCLSSYMLV
jgi:hypothetical protein